MFWPPNFGFVHLRAVEQVVEQRGRNPGDGIRGGDAFVSKPFVTMF